MNTRMADALPHKQRATIRRFVAMDIENMNGGAVQHTGLAAAAWVEVADAIDLLDCEQVVVGVGPSSLIASGVTCPARFVMGRGLDGADHALIEVLETERVAERFEEVVIVSGDGIFAEVAAALGAQGVVVTVVARDGHLSARLRMAAARVVLLPDHPRFLGEAA